MKSPIITDFSAGELSPKFTGRVDIAAYQKGCLTLENWVPFSQGGITTRPGTTYLGTTKSSNPAVIVPFVINRTTSFLLEFTASVLRVWQDDVLVDDGGSPLEVAIPYSTIAEIKELSFAQDENKLFLFHSGYAPRVLTWTTPTTFSLDTMSFVGNAGALPFQASGDYPSCGTFFINRLWFAGSENNPSGVWAARSYTYTSGYDWEPTTQYTVDTIIENDSGKLYRCTTAGVSAASGGPTGTGTSIADGSCVWDYWCLAGNIDMTYFDTTAYTITQLKDVAEWADPDVPETEEVTTYSDTIGDDNAMEFELSGECEEVLFLVARNMLVIGTVSSEHVADKSITANEIDVPSQTYYGCTKVQPITFENSVVFLQRSGRKLREYYYSYDDDAYESPDLTYQADHILESGGVDIDATATPEPMIFVVRDDGEIAVLLHNKTVGVSAWHRYVDGAGDVYESVAILPGTDADAMYVSVSRGGVRCIEKFDTLLDNDAIPLDSKTEVTISAATESGLDRLEGETVTIYNTTDGTVHTAVVTGGEITYPSGDDVGDEVTIGMGFICIMKTLPILTQQDEGVAVITDRRIANVRMQLLNSYPFKTGYSNTDALLEETPITGPYTGGVHCPFRGNWDMDTWVMAVQDEPYHSTILAIIPEVE